MTSMEWCFAANQAGYRYPGQADTVVRMGWVLKGNPIFCAMFAQGFWSWPSVSFVTPLSASEKERFAEAGLQVPEKLEDFLDKAPAPAKNDDHWQ